MSMPTRQIVKRKPRVGDVYDSGVISELRRDHFEFTRPRHPSYPNESDRQICSNNVIEVQVYYGEFSEFVTGLRVLHGEESAEMTAFLAKLVSEKKA